MTSTQTPTLKNNCITATYISCIDFRCPHDLNKVFDWELDRTKLFVTVNEGDDAEEYDALNGHPDDFKYPTTFHIRNEDDISYKEPSPLKQEVLNTSDVDSKTPYATVLTAAEENTRPSKYDGWALFGPSVAPPAPIDI
jgi:hypothetical protein